ncbi:hypothetical protein GCM10023224_26550 [Streptomonospora halophila]|uniref:Uncharacterized protein n=1 Tax=Streptomonospora halophila TaxID=427369 RepID=A0ABP9GKI5_9ACTN
MGPPHNGRSRRTCCCGPAGGRRRPPLPRLGPSALTRAGSLSAPPRRIPRPPETLAPALIAALCAAFWQRSLGWGLVVIDGGLAVKIA